MKPCVFIHTNDRQIVGALVGQHALKRNSADPDSFDVKLIKTDDHHFLRDKEGQKFLRKGKPHVWSMGDLQSFTPLRFMPPELMGYEGQALVIDPDVFAVGDVTELLLRDMQGKAIMCRPRSGSKGASGALATSVMLLDCARLTHWRCEEQFNEMFAFKLDYGDWITLDLEDRGTIGIFENEWNDFDNLTPATRMVHNTKRQTQPWKTGLPVDFTAAEKKASLSRPATWLKPLKALARGGKPRQYIQHPDPRQEAYFFGLLRECIEAGSVTEDMLREEMRENHVRHDALEVIERTPPLAA